MDSDKLLSFGDFLKVEMRIGKIIEATDFPEAHKPAYKLRIDFGEEIGVKKTSAQITHHYSKEQLVGKLVVAVVNFGPKQIGKFMSEVLVLGAPDEAGEIILIEPGKNGAQPGERIC